VVVVIHHSAGLDQRADCLADAAREALGAGTVQVARWSLLAEDADPAVREGAESIWKWLTDD